MADSGTWETGSPDLAFGPANNHHRRNTMKYFLLTAVGFPVVFFLYEIIKLAQTLN